MKKGEYEPMKQLFKETLIITLALAYLTIGFFFYPILLDILAIVTIIYLLIKVIVTIKRYYLK